MKWDGHANALLKDKTLRYTHKRYLMFNVEIEKIPVWYVFPSKIGLSRGHENSNGDPFIAHCSIPLYLTFIFYFYHKLRCISILFSDVYF